MAHASMTAAAATAGPRTPIARLLLRADGLLVGAAGALLLARARPLAPALGVSAGWPLAALGAACVPYGAWLSWTTRRASSARVRRLVGRIAVGNMAWVLVSVALLLGRSPTWTRRRCAAP